MKIVIELNTENAAFEGDLVAEVTRILRTVPGKIRGQMARRPAMCTAPEASDILLDVNGNKCGTVTTEVKVERSRASVHITEEQADSFLDNPSGEIKSTFSFNGRRWKIGRPAPDAKPKWIELGPAQGDETYFVKPDRQSVPKSENPTDKRSA